MHFGHLITAFGLIFVAELPDKTAYTVLLLATRNRPLPVLIGSWAAFFVQGLIAVAMGSLLARLSPDVVRWSAAAALLVFGLVLLFKDDAPERPPAGSPRRALVQSFVLVFLAELGDATQIGTAALVARLDDRWSVFVGATLALWAVSALAVTVGRSVGSRLPKRALRKAAGALFVAVAIVSAFVAR